MRFSVPVEPRMLAALAGALALLTACGKGGSGTGLSLQKEYYVSPEGSDENPGTLSAPFLTVEKARDAVRTHLAPWTADVTITLRTGTYYFNGPLILDRRDSGKDGYSVIYRAYPGERPVLSGGIPIGGWSLHDPARNIYKATVGTSLQTRQVYVNGRRAVRARGPVGPSGWQKTLLGFTAPNASMGTWGNISDVEIVCFSSWKSFRCGIAAVSGREVVMKQPGWNNCQLHGVRPMDGVTWIENAYELLDEDGEWYLDRTAGVLYYKPRAGEQMSSALVSCPIAEELVHGSGTAEDPIHDVRFMGLTFAENTWLKPNTGAGYAVLQAGFTLTGGANWELEKTPAAVRFSAARNIRIERNTFTRLGSAGLSFEGGSRDNLAIGNVFKDISSSAVMIGDADDDGQQDVLRQNTGNILRNNYITRTGAEYFDSAAIWAGYVADSIIDHNEICDVPYTGISLGWGWGTPSYAARNVISNNRIERTMQVLRDGGAIYTLSDQPGSSVTGNYIRSTERGLYHDEGSGFFTDRRNVVEDASDAWLILWTASIHDNDIQFNWYDADNTLSSGTNNTVANNSYRPDRNWSPEAVDVIESAGLEPSYQDLRPQ